MVVRSFLDFIFVDDDEVRDHGHNNMIRLLSDPEILKPYLVELQRHLPDGPTPSDMNEIVTWVFELITKYDGGGIHDDLVRLLNDPDALKMLSSRLQQYQREVAADQADYIARMAATV